MVKSANFDFVKKIDSDMYSKLLDAEKLVNTNYDMCFNSIRTALEMLLKTVTKNEGLNDEYLTFVERSKDKKDNLFNRIKFLERKSPTNLPTRDRITTKGTEIKEGRIRRVNKSFNNRMDFIRICGNSGSHDDESGTSLKSYDNAVLALSCIFHLISTYFKNSSKLEGTEIKNFDKNLLMIDDYSIEKSYTPEDQNETMCIREYKGYKLDEDGKIDIYTIIRKYPLTRIDDTYLNREYKIHDSIVRRYIPHAKQIPNIEKINNQGNLNSQYDFILIAYNFYHEPLDINNEILKQLSFEQRLDICIKVIDYFDVFHNGKDKIYHRMFNYKCVKLCRYDDEYIPFIIKLNFAKITDNSKTVISYAGNAKKSLSKQQIEKYLPYEWDWVATDPNPQWDKVDIFSLGVFLSDMLMGSISSAIPKASEMKGIIPDEIIELIINMTDEDIYNRPDCKTVLEVLNNARD